MGLVSGRTFLLCAVSLQFSFVMSKPDSRAIWAFPGAIDSAYNGVGKLECDSADHATGFPVFQKFLTRDYDFGGTSVCELSCGGGCYPYKYLSIRKPPISLYPWWCKCDRDRCDENGPKPPISWDMALTELRCEADSDCNDFCKEVEPENENYRGFICNWLNLNAGESLKVQYASKLSPIRWCECCPASDRYK